MTDPVSAVDPIDLKIQAAIADAVAKLKADEKAEVTKFDAFVAKIEAFVKAHWAKVTTGVLGFAASHYAVIDIIKKFI